MKFEKCPLCGEATDVGSHWDCVFEMMAAWVSALEERKEPADLGARPGEGGVKNG